LQAHAAVDKAAEALTSAREAASQALDS